MIKRLERRIRLILMIPLILIMILMSCTYLYMNYDRVMSEAAERINSLSSIADEYKGLSGDNGKREDSPPAKPEGDIGDNPEPQSQGSEDASEKRENGGDGTQAGAGKSSAALSDVGETIHDPDSGDYLYEFMIQDSQLIYRNTQDEEKIDIAFSFAYGEEQRGVRPDFFYRTRKSGENSYTVKLLYSEELKGDLIRTMILAAVILVLSVVSVILISVLISKIVIKPVIRNEEKQKTFISDTSHELKTPLAVIAVNADMLENEVGENNKWLGYIQSEVSGMEKLIGNLLLLLSSETNKENEAFAEFDLSAVSEMCVAVFEASAYECGITLKTVVAPGIRFVGYEDDIKHIISPLVDNAVKHTPRGGSVLFMLKEEKAEAVITVQNEGEPIPEEDREKIFDRFYRVDKARNRSENRYGLGLPIVRTIAEKYDGKVTVQCENGLTAFTVRLKSRRKPS